MSCKLFGTCANQTFHEQSFITEYFKIEAERSNWAETCLKLQILVLELQPEIPFAQLKVDLEEDKGNVSLLVALAPEGRKGYSKYMDIGVMPALFDPSGEYAGGRFNRQISLV